MRYPFYRHSDIIILYLFIGIFAIGILASLIYQVAEGFAISAVGFFALLIVLIGHEIIIVLLDIKKILKDKNI
jgi:hypothetical protein